MPEAAFLRLFGVPRLELADGRQRVFTAERPYQTLIHLACRAGWVSRDEVATWLWPERTQAAARSNLRKVLSLAQKIDGVPPIEQQGDRLRWMPDSDLQRFVQACDAQRDDEALRWYRPPLMQAMEAGLSSAAAAWLAFERESTATRWQQAAARSLAALADEPAACMARALDLLAHDPFDETSLTALARSAVTLGQPSPALRVLDEHAARLASELAVQPSAELRRLVAQLRQLATVDRPTEPIRPKLDAPPPVDLAGFIGRRFEIGRVHDALRAGDARVLTLVGPGGVGKSSLARAVLRRTGAEFAAGAWWVPLAELGDAEQLWTGLAGALGIELRGAVPARQQVTRFVADGEALVVLDNAEHLPGLGPLLSGWLGDCPRLKLLITSRVRLSIAGESLQPVDGLPLPDVDETDADVLRHNDAVQLFERRARAMAPDFTLAGQTDAVVRLVRSVDGLPLAIELAAASVRWMTVSTIVDELSRSLDVLEMQSAVQPRERGLRASFAQSWRLLSEAERVALCRLSLLPGDFDREMASQVAQCAFPLLLSLADQSLLKADGQGRFGLHPLIRLCAAEKMVDIDIDAADLRDRHAGYVTRWMSRQDDGERNFTPDFLAQIEREFVHVRAAWAWSRERRLPEVVSRCTRAVQAFVEQRGRWAEGLAMFEGAVRAFEADEPHSRPSAVATAAACRGLAALQIRWGRPAEAERWARRAARLARRMGDLRLHQGCLNTIGLSLFLRGSFAEARPFFTQGLRLAGIDGDARGRRVLLGNLAIVEEALGHYDAALPLYGQVLDESLAIGEISGAHICLNNMGNSYRGSGDLDAALASYRRALDLCRQHGEVTRVASKLLNIGVTLHAMGDLVQARTWMNQALADVRANGVRSMEAATLLADALVLGDEGELAAAHAQCREAAGIGRDIASLDLQAHSLFVHGELLVIAGRAEEGARWLAFALRQPGLHAVERDMARRRLAARGIDAAVLERAAADAPADGSMAGLLDAIARHRETDTKRPRNA